jgi:hypothetical protein
MIKKIVPILNMTKKIKQIYIYRDSHLPEEGWLQSCFQCYQITSKTCLFKTYKTKKKNSKTYWEIYIHVCNKCNNHLKNDENYYDFLNKYNNYMNIHYPILETG